MDKSENINEHAKYKIDKTIIAEITLINEITIDSGKIDFVLMSNDITNWIKTLDITIPDNRPVKIAKIITTPYSKNDITNLLIGETPIASFIALSCEDWISLAI